MPEGALGLGQATKSDSGCFTAGERPQAPPPFAASPDTCSFAIVEVHLDLRGGAPVLPLEW